jgi:hypothetical protein
VSAELEVLRAKVEPRKRRGVCADCGNPREVYFQVAINDAERKTRNHNFARLRSGSLVLCAACALRRFEEIFRNGEATP